MVPYGISRISTIPVQSLAVLTDPCRAQRAKGPATPEPRHSATTGICYPTRLLTSGSSGSSCNAAHRCAPPRILGSPWEVGEGGCDAAVSHRTQTCCLGYPRSPRYAGANHWEGELHISLRLCKPRLGHLLSRPATGYGPWVTPGRPVSRRLPPSHGCVDHHPPVGVVSVGPEAREHGRPSDTQGWGARGGRPKANWKARTARPGGEGRGRLI